MTLTLEDLGWGPPFEAAFAEQAAPGWIPARVAIQHRDRLVLLSARGEIQAEIAGHLFHHAASKLDLPAVGDWVAIEPPAGDGLARVELLLPRRTRLVRKAAGDRAVPQVIGANLDTVLVVASLNQDFNPARIDRYLAAIAEGGAGAGLVLSKADLCDDPGALITQLSAVAAALPRAVVSAKGDLGREALQMFLEPRTTIALVGSSGVGKSSLINWLLGEERQATREIRGDERGRHATTRRELVVMPGGTLLIDTPGMRELEPWDAGEALEQVFDDLEQLAAECRFRDCAHHEEPGCAVRAAIEAGDLPPERLEQWLKLQREQRHQRAQGDPLERKRMRDEWQKKVREMGERHRLERGGGKGRRE